MFTEKMKLKRLPTNPEKLTPTCTFFQIFRFIASLTIALTWGQHASKEILLRKKFLSLQICKIKIKIIIIIIQKITNQKNLILNIHAVTFIKRTSLILMPIPNQNISNFSKLFEMSSPKDTSQNRPRRPVFSFRTSTPALTSTGTPWGINLFIGCDTGGLSSTCLPKLIPWIFLIGKYWIRCFRITL